ncbi:hypothetical protein Hanom_Chr05g00456131 [Helianthus anomalus]
MILPLHLHLLRLHHYHRPIYTPHLLQNYSTFFFYLFVFSSILHHIQLHRLYHHRPHHPRYYNHRPYLPRCQKPLQRTLWQNIVEASASFDYYM